MAEGDVSCRLFSRLTTSLFTAVLNQHRWTDFLRDLSIAAGDVKTHLFGYDTVSHVTLDLISHGYDPGFLQSYNSYYGTRNAWAKGFSRMPQAVVVDTEAMCPTSELVMTDFYADWLRPQEEITVGGGTLIFKDDKRMFALGGNIRRRDGERLKDPWLNLVARLVPHLQQAFEISRTLEGRSIEAEAAGQAGCQSQSAVFILNQARKIIYCNDAAEELAAAGDPVRIDRNGVVGFGSQEATARLAEAAKSLVESDSQLSSTFHVLTRADRKAFSVRLARFEPTGRHESPFGLFLSDSGICLLMAITERRSEASLIDRLTTLYGVTRTEAQIATMLAKGLDIREIALERSVSDHTVRNQVKSVLSKMNLRRQSDVVRLVVSEGTYVGHYLV